MALIESRTSEYNIWRDMRQRCYNASNPSFKDYGGRGITVCRRWLVSYYNFLGDMGRKPSEKHTLGRIDNDGNYQPDNCEWQTYTQQERNRRFPFVKLTMETARELRQLQKHYSYIQLGRMFNIDPKTAWRVAVGEIWKE